MTTQGIDKIVAVEGTVERHTAGYGNTIIFHPDLGDEMRVHTDANDIGPRNVTNMYWAGILGTRCRIEVREPEKKSSYVQWEMTSFDLMDQSNYAEKVHKLKDPLKVIDDLRGLMDFRVLHPVPGVLSKPGYHLVYARDIIHWTDGSVTIIEYGRDSQSGALTSPKLLPPVEVLSDLIPVDDILEDPSYYDFRTSRAFDRYVDLSQIGRAYVHLSESFPPEPSLERFNPFMDILGPAATLALHMRNRISEALYRKR